ncbi:MAG: NAD-dependent epimerase/dehydratase family protein [Planctomycetia bacterium]|nr:NAD-dependent epimerase/dehydratase family protein [Planctomycetia bacterium]
MKTVLITGANGEIGHGLIEALAANSGTQIVALDLNSPDESIRKKCYRTVVGDITDASVVENLGANYDFDIIIHLAALLSTKSERMPKLAHMVNVDGTLNLLELAVSEARQQGKPIRFIYPSSIAVYGMPDVSTKAKSGKVLESDWCEPRTMYGINKLYCEKLGNYYQKHYRQLDIQESKGLVDFRGIRFPGLISAFTLPTGGTSDFAPEMIHAAAKKQTYKCFVRPDTRIPFMAMPDGVSAILKLAEADNRKLSKPVYNLAGFNPSAEEFRVRVLKAFPEADIQYQPDQRRQLIVDSWPADVNDSAARNDWGFQPQYDFERAFSEYLLPNIVKHHQ